MMKLRLAPEYYWLLIFGLSFIAYQQVQDTIRPYYHGDNAIIKYLLGVAPNFFPGIGIPALFVVLIPQLRPKGNSSNQWLMERRYITANIVSVTGLLLWEFTQPLTSRGRFDWNDVIFTIIGALVFQLIWSLSPSRYKQVADLR